MSVQKRLRAAETRDAARTGEANDVHRGHFRLPTSLTHLMATFSARPADIAHQWFLVDADGQVLGRLASEVARIIRGKHKPSFTPHMDTGDNVIVVNAAKVRVTGRKAEQKQYFAHSGYMGHDKLIPFATVLARHPERVIERAVHGMLPKNALGRQKLRLKLRFYPGAEHPHVAQQPTPLSFAKRAERARPTPGGAPKAAATPHKRGTSGTKGAK